MSEQNTKLPSKFITRSEIMDLYGIGKTKLNELMHGKNWNGEDLSGPKFPKPYTKHGRYHKYLRIEVETWFEKTRTA